jgi:hypothetical protein
MRRRAGISRAKVDDIKGWLKGRLDEKARKREEQRGRSGRDDGVVTPPPDYDV